MSIDCSNKEYIQGSNVVDDVLNEFLGIIENQPISLKELITYLKNLKQTIELNISSPHDLNILQVIVSLKIPNSARIAMEDMEDINQLKYKILELYSKRK